MDDLETGAFEGEYWRWSSGSVGHYEYTVVVEQKNHIAEEAGVEMVAAL